VLHIIHLTYKTIERNLFIAKNKTLWSYQPILYFKYKGGIISYYSIR